MIKGFIFDMDGVIVDTEPLYLDNVRNILAELNIAITETELHTYVGISSREMWQTIIARHGLQKDMAWLVDTEQCRVLRTLQDSDHLEPMAGIPELMRFLHQNDFKVGLASSSRRQVIDLILQRLKLSDWFEATVSGEEVTIGKPDPEIFLHVSQALGKPSDRCLVVEDSANGVKAAQAAGMRCVLYVKAHHSASAGIKADEIIKRFSIDDFEQFLQWLQ